MSGEASTTSFGQQPTTSAASNYTPPSLNTLDYFDYSSQQTHDLLWLSLGVYLGFYLLSFTMKGIEMFRKKNSREAMAADLRRAESELQTARHRIETLIVEKRRETQKLRDQVLETDRERSRTAAGQAIIDTLRPFREEADTLRPQLADLNRRIASREEEIARLSVFESEAITQRQEVDTLREMVTTLEGTIAGLTPLAEEASNLRPQIERLTRMIQERDQTIRDVRENLTQRTRERDQARERMVYVQQQVVVQVGLATEWRGHYEEKEREIEQIRECHIREFDDRTRAFDERMSFMENQHEELVKCLRKQHDDAELALRVEMASLQTAHAQEIDTLEAKRVDGIQELTSRMNDLELEHKKEIEELKKKAKEEQEHVIRVMTFQLSLFGKEPEG